MEIVDFSIVEIRLIQSLWEHKSIQFIANMLDRPFGIVERKVKEMNAVQKVKLFQPPTFERILKKKEKEVRWAKKQMVQQEIKIKNTNNLEMISIRINAKTIIQVKPGTDIEKVKAKYSKNAK